MNRHAVATLLTLFALGSPLAAGTETASAEVKVSLNDTARQTHPSAVFDGRGSAIAVWENSQLGILARQVALDSGDAAASPEVSLVANRLLSSVPGAGNVAFHRQPTAVADGKGGFYLLWTRERAYLVSYPFQERRDITDRDVLCRHFTGSGKSLSAITRVHDDASGWQSQPRVVRLSNGKLFVTWHSDDRDSAISSSDGVFGRLLGQNCAPLGEAFRISNPQAGAAAANAALAAGDHRVAVVWEARDGSSNGVLRKLFDESGAALGPQARVNTTTAGRQGAPSIAHLDGQGFLVLWQGETGERRRTRIYGQRLSGAGEPVGVETEVSEGAGEYELAPSVVEAGGGFYAVWMLWDKTFPLALRGADLDAQGGAVGDASTVNTFQVGAQHRTFLVSDPAQGVLAVWEGYFQRQNRPGISARAFAVEP